MPPPMSAETKPFNLLVLCTGNICRSPIAEAMLAQKLKTYPGVRLSSAGVAAPTGVSPDANAVRSSVAYGYAVSSEKRSRQVSLADLSTATLILVMEKRHKQYVRRRAPIDANKVFLFGEWTVGEIPDPIGRDAVFFDSTTKLLEAAADAWVSRIQNIVGQ